jgi:hypothetical protein
MINSIKPLMLVALAITSLAASCATPKLLPSSSLLVNFEGQEGMVKPSQYQKLYTFDNYSLEDVISASRTGLERSNFRIIEEHLDDMFILGEHSSTAYNYNLLAGVYFSEQASQVTIKVIVQGSIPGAKSGNGKTEVARKLNVILTEIIGAL